MPAGSGQLISRLSEPFSHCRLLRVLFGGFLAQNLHRHSAWRTCPRTTRMSATQTQLPVDPRATISEIVVFGHSPLFYWWPVWSLGYVMALLTYAQGSATQLGDGEVMMHPSQGLGVIYTAVFLLGLL